MTSINRTEQGSAILHHLRQQGIRITVLFTSTLEDADLLVRVCRVGNVEFIPKRDLLDDPSLVLYPLEQTTHDRALLRHLIRATGVHADRLCRNWLLSRRDEWARRWAEITRGILEQAVVQLDGRLDVGG